MKLSLRIRKSQQLEMPIMKTEISNHFTSLAPRLTGTQSAREIRGATPHAGIEDEPAPKPIVALLRRGMRQRCPQCGQGPLFRGWIKMHDRCSACGLQYLPNQGDLLAFQMVLNKGLFIFPLIVLMYFRLYVPDIRWFYLLTGVLLILFVGTLPHRTGMALAVDYLIRRKWGDLSEAKTQLRIERCGENQHNADERADARAPDGDVKWNLIPNRQKPPTLIRSRARHASYSRRLVAQNANTEISTN